MVTDRWVHVYPRRMAGVWTTFLHLFPDLHEVPIGTPTDYPVLRFAYDRKVARQIEAACDRPPLPEGAMPVFDLAYYPGPLPSIGQRPRGYFLRQALAEHRHRGRHGIYACAEQREVEGFTHQDRLKFYPVVPTWWSEYEVPRGMAARIGNLVALRGSRRMADGPDSAASATLNACWLVQVADVLLSSGLFYGHAWLIPLPLLRALQESPIDALRQDHPDRVAYLRSLLLLLEEVHLKALPSYLGLPFRPRLLVRCSRSLTYEGVLLLEEGLGHEELPYAPGMEPTTRVPAPETSMEEEGPRLPGFDQERYRPSMQPNSPKGSYGERGSAVSSGGRSSTSPPPRSFPPREEIRAPGGRRVLVPEPVAPFRRGGSPLALPRPIPVTTVAALGQVFDPPPPALRDADEESLVMGLCRAYTGLANDMAAIVATRADWQDIPPVALPLLSQEALAERLDRELGRANMDTMLQVPRLFLRGAAEAACGGGGHGPRYFTGSHSDGRWGY